MLRVAKFTVQSLALLFHPLRSRLPPSRSLLLQRKTLMTTHPLGKIGRCVLWFSPVVIVVIGFLAAIPWLKQQNDTFVLALTAVASIFVMGYADRKSTRLNSSH